MTADSTKRPIEFYGRSLTELGQRTARRVLGAEACPFLKRRCTKQRKSDPSQTIGACTVGYGGDTLIICPHRFVERDQVFLDSVRFLQPNLTYFVVPEITVQGGSVDYFLVGARGDEILDYCGVEIQSLDTTGSGGIWAAREDLLRGRLGQNYPYGINWKMSAKTVLVQMHHKAASFEALGKKLALVMQTKFLDYIRRTFETDQLRPAQASDSVHLHVYDLVALGTDLRLVLTSTLSTDVRGVERMLCLGAGHEVLEQDVVRQLQSKMPSARRLKIAH